MEGAASERPLTVLAIGGNSLLEPGEPVTAESQFEATRRAMGPVAELLARGERIVITHGNGPQVGFLQLRSELAKGVLHEVPLDSLVADTQGSIGYMIERALREALDERGLDLAIAAVLTEVEVDPADPAFREPTKPIGRFYSEKEARQLERRHRWRLVSDSGRGFRRVVVSPAPLRIVQLDVFRSLVRDGVVLVCCGGGGIPVVRDGSGRIRGLEAVIDKDRTSALLAAGLGAGRLVITTGVEVVYRDFLSEHRQALPELTVSEVLALDREGQFPEGSMRPKMEAAVTFLREKAGEVLVTSPGRLVEAFDGRTGTRIRRDR